MKTLEHKKKRHEDFEILEDVSNEDFSKTVFCRIFAVNKVFTDVVFKQCVIDNCYFRNCKFIRCDFTGAEFNGNNFRGAQFEGCKFNYSTWEKSVLDDDFLDSCLPSEENMARDLVQELRVNFSQIGNYPAVNKAASLEVKLTGVHLYKSAYSRESYYRSKYKGIKRLGEIFKHLKWKFLDVLWGNGESILRVVVSSLITVILISLTNYFLCGGSFFETVKISFLAFLGMEFNSQLSLYFSAALVISRFLFFGLFMAILVKRLARR